LRHGHAHVDLLASMRGDWPLGILVSLWCWHGPWKYAGDFPLCKCLLVAWRLSFARGNCARAIPEAIPRAIAATLATTGNGATLACLPCGHASALATRPR
jgi:hypothetical protein